LRHKRFYFYKAAIGGLIALLQNLWTSGENLANYRPIFSKDITVYGSTG
jgi:hypothetical protein